MSFLWFFRTSQGTSDGCEKSHVVKGMKSLKKCKEERLVFQPSICPGFKEGKFWLPERKKGRHTVLHRICVVLARTLLRLWQCRGVGHPSVWKPTGQKLPKPGCEKIDFSLGRNSLLNFKRVVTRASSFGSFFGGAYVTTLGSRYSENACHV